ncbi:MAG: hypothetical protein U5L10_01170 [Candidatus Moranbacteria bacterium]|nr:hypothetical protein [Candidatus Moranbacteria bacterium]
MEINLTKHWHYLLALIILFIFDKITPSSFIISAVGSFLLLLLIVMWINFAKNNKQNTVVKSTKKDKKNSDKIDNKEGYESKQKNQLLKNVVIVGIVIVSISVAYTFLIMPIKKEYDLKRCLEDSGEIYERKKNEIDSHIKSLEEEKKVLEKEANGEIEEFDENNPEPKVQDYPEKTGNKEDGDKTLVTKILESNDKNWDYINAHAEWRSKRRSIFEPVRKIEDKINLIKTDYEKIQNNKNKRDERCFKLYK